MSDILKKLLDKAHQERAQAEDSTSEADRRKHIDQANEYLKKINEIVPEEMRIELYEWPRGASDPGEVGIPRYPASHR